MEIKTDLEKELPFEPAMEWNNLGQMFSLRYEGLVFRLTEYL